MTPEANAARMPSRDPSVASVASVASVTSVASIASVGSVPSLRLPSVWLLMAAVVLASAAALYVVKLKHDWAVERLHDVEQRYARLTGLEAGSADLARAESAARAALAARVYPVGMDVSQAGNDAQGRVRDAVSAAGLQVMSSQVLPSKIDKVFDRIPLVVRLEGELPGLHAALRALPGLSPAVLIDSVGVQTIGAVRVDAPQKLSIQLTLSVLRARP